MGCSTADGQVPPGPLAATRAVAGATSERLLGPRELAAIGARVRRLRLEAGWTQEEIGHPFSKAYVSQIETGRVPPSLALLSVIASRLGTSVEQLAPEVGSGHRPEDVARLWAAAERLGRHGELTSELEMLEQASRLAALVGDPDLQGQALLRHADALRKAGRIEAALAATTAAFEVYGRAGPSRLLGRCYVSAAMTYRDRGDLERSQVCLEQALRHLPRRETEYARALIDLGRTLLRLGRPEDAGARAEQAAALCRACGDAREEALAYLLLVEVRLEQQRPSEAELALDLARDVVERMADGTLADALPALEALVAFACGRSDASELETSLQAADAAGDDAACVLLARALAASYLGGHDAHAALAIAEIGLLHARRAKDWMYVAELAARLALALILADRPEEAASALVRAREAYTAMRRTGDIEDTLREIAARLPVVPPALKALLEPPSPL